MKLNICKCSFKPVIKKVFMAVKQKQGWAFARAFRSTPHVGFASLASLWGTCFNPAASERQMLC